jgi:molecular chaperone GrpE
MGADVTERRPDDPGAEEPAAPDAAPARDDDTVAPDARETAPAAAVTPGGGAAGEAGPAAPTVDFRDRWLRSEADFQNYRRRAQRDLEEARRNSEEGVMLEVIAALDDLERAIAAAETAGSPDSWTAGVRLVANRLGEYLARQGVTAVDPLGQPFDPAFHEALLEVDAPAGAVPGAVVQVIHKGYRRGPRALRAARVVVAKRESVDGA